MNVVCNHRMDGGFSSSEELVEAINVGLVLHVKSMLVVRYYVYFQIIVNFPSLLYFIIITKAIVNTIGILIYKADSAFSFFGWEKAMDFKSFIGNTKFIYILNFLL